MEGGLVKTNSKLIWLMNVSSSKQRRHVSLCSHSALYALLSIFEKSLLWIISLLSIISLSFDLSLTI